MDAYLGIDSSNYTSSAALYSAEAGVLSNERKLLPVAEGQLGLRQSDAVFHHVKNLPEVLERALSAKHSLKAVGVSTRPRDIEGSYMPCFLAGVALAETAAAVAGVPLCRFSHQAGHVAAALYSCGQTKLIGSRFIAFHISGGTTEALLVTPHSERIFDCRVIAESLDLKAGQLVDRVGGLLGLRFPAGPQLDRLAATSGGIKTPKPVLKGRDCCLSGVENQCAGLLRRGVPAADIARYAIESVCAALDAMTAGILSEYGELPLIFAGGVMSNSIIRDRLEKKYGASFAAPEFSSDNAAGIALLACLKSL